MSRLRTALLIVLAMGTWSAPVSAQEQQQPTVAADPLFETLFPPELIMQHRRAIGLTDEQRDAISRMIQDLQGRVLRLQWELQEQVQELADATRGTRVDLDLALDRMDKVLDTEKQIKQAHLEMLVRIKNLLTEQQQATLERLRGDGSGGA